MKFLADENFTGSVFHALSRRLLPGTLARVQDVGLMGTDDPTILEWAAGNDYIVLTHDAATFSDFAYERVGAFLPMPGVFQVHQGESLKLIVDTIETIQACSSADEWRDRVTHLPF